LAGVAWTIGVLCLLLFVLNGVKNTFRFVTTRKRSLTEFSSNFWLALIVLGAVLAAIGNLNFNIARDREKGESASAKAMSMLRAEMQRNLQRISNIRGLKPGMVATSSFETTAWNVVSTGGLLVQMDQATLGQVADAYHLLGQAEIYRSEVVNRTVGIAAAIGGGEVTTQQYIKNFHRILDELEPKLRSLTAAASMQ
jgi:hypothetical protein